MTCSQLACLLEIRRLSERSKDVASVRLTRQLGLSKPSVHRLLEGLRAMGLIDKEFYGAARLTQRGEQLADEMLLRAEILSQQLEKGIVRPESSLRAALLLLTMLDETSFGCFEADSGTGTEKQIL